ncbi:hypothetical protein BCR42DRAFT_401343 [Absidia repens]|uniref:SCD domain-containing protein n=1 Tax=Absidia repens TaxID=90262 RepID=A0A1X2J2A9_9FUNG|nr:hypothetical protein BCR42DRAFT_401343 [Absidia repens]
MTGRKATKKDRATRLKTMPEFFQRKRQLPGSRKRATDDIDSSSDSSNDEDDDQEQDELDSGMESSDAELVDDDDGSDNEFNPTSRKTGAGDSVLAGSSLSKAKMKTKASSKGKRTSNKKRRTELEVTLLSSSQLLSQVSEQDEGISLYDQTLRGGADVEDMVTTWVQQYESTKIPALQALINFVIRSSGCKMAVTTEAFADENGTVNALQELQKHLEELPYHEYPIISKTKEYRNLKRNLLEFFQILIDKCQTTLIYDGTLIETLQSWLTTMSSSVYRPFRHTATLIALKVTGELCVLASKLYKELNTLKRQLTANRKKGDRNNVIKKRVDQLKPKQKDLDDIIHDFFASVFNHRSRDVESVVRSECIKEFYVWIHLYPAHFGDNMYFRYFGWALNDPVSSVRSESLKSITKLCKSEELMNKMEVFIQRFVSRIEEMALYDVDPSVRVHAIGLCNTLYINDKNIISDSGRKALTNLVSSSNSRIRKSVAPFVKSIIDTDIFRPTLDRVEQSLSALTVTTTAAESESSISRNHRTTATYSSNALKPSANKSWVVFKSIAEFLSPRIKLTANINTDENSLRLDDVSVFDHHTIQIIDNTVESIWSLIQELQDYQAMAIYLSHDHSTIGSSQHMDYELGDPVDDTVELEPCYQLTDVEESVLLYVFVICLNKLAKNENSNEKKKDNAQSHLDETPNKITQTLIQFLPKLIRKYGDDMNILSQLTQLPQLMNMNVYLELRKEDAYKDLLQQLCKLYSTITLPEILQTCSSSIHHMMKATFLSESNGPLMVDLRKRIVSQVRDACRGKELYTARFTTDDLHTIATTVTRLDYLIGIVDTTDDMDDTSDMKADVMDLMGELVDRSVLGYDGESQIGQSALSILFRYLVWRCSYLVEDGMVAFDTAMLNKIERRRNWTIEKCTELLFTTDDTAPLPEVQRLAFSVLIDTYTIFSSDMFLKSDLNLLHHKCNNATQLQLITFLSSEIESWQASKHKDASSDKNNEEVDRKAWCLELMTSYSRGLTMGVLDLQHGSIILKQYGEHGDEIIDMHVKAFVEDLEEDLMGYTKLTEQICRLYLNALEQSFKLHVDMNYRSVDKMLKLGRLLCQSFKQANENNENSQMLENIVCDRIHLDGIDFALGNAREAKPTDDDALAIALKFFKVLTLFAKQLNRARDIGKIHKHLESRLQEYQLKPVVGEKEWEPYFAYTKTMDDLLKKKGLRFDYGATN